MKKRLFSLLVLFTTILFMSVFVEDTKACRPNPVTISVAEGEVLEISETTEASCLTIAEGASIIAPSGNSLTLTVNGIGTAIEPGIYIGKIVLTVTEDIIVSSQKFRTGIYVEDGQYIPEKSVASIVRGGKVTDNYAKNIKITSEEDNFNGIIATGSTIYSVINPRIILNGNGGGDFIGYGAALMTDGTADLTVDKAKIITDGCIRSIAVIKGNSTLRINNSYMETGNPELPEVVTGMMQVPWMLGLTGTCRSINMIDYGTEYINNSYIKAAAWGALSTDATKTVRMNVKNSRIEVVESGYGSYSIGDSVNTFSKCKFDVADMALIMANEVACGVFTDRTVVNSGRFGVMMHGGNVGTLTIDKGSVFNTDETVIQVKSSYPEIIVDNAKLNSKNGIILQTMINDDPMSGAGEARDVNASFSNMTLNGDIVTSMTSLSNLNVSFKNAKITGAISTATVESEAERQGVDFTTLPPFSNEGVQYAYLIGWIYNTYCDPGEAYGLNVSFDSKSKWVVDEASYLTGLSIAEGAKICAPKNYRLVMTVDGVETPIMPGDYSGKIVIAPVHK